MQFVYHQDSGVDILTINDQLHKYIFKVRRHDSSKPLFFRNLIDDILYKYEVISINKKNTTLKLIESKELKIALSQKLHIGWCKIDFKSIEKVIASLNELGVDKITFIDCQYSQKQYKINFDKLHTLLTNSSSQSGRSDIIKLEVVESLDKFLELYPDSYMFNFSSNNITNYIDKIDTIVVGCEGGFSDDEIAKFSPSKIVGVDNPLILRSETAVLTVASKLL